jgi:hypothetical protein
MGSSPFLIYSKKNSNKLIPLKVRVFECRSSGELSRHDAVRCSILITALDAEVAEYFMTSIKVTTKN